MRSSGIHRSWLELLLERRARIRSSILKPVDWENQQTEMFLSVTLEEALKTAVADQEFPKNQGASSQSPVHRILRMRTPDLRRPLYDLWSRLLL